MGEPAEVPTKDPAQSLSPPTSPSTSTREDHPAPASDTEKIFAEVLAEVVKAEQVSVDSHFFDDLGADSMVMAHFCARVRKRPDLPSVSMKDIYRYTTVRSLATALGDVEPVPAEAPAPPPAEVVKPGNTLHYVLCGIFQLLVFLGYSYLTALATTRAYGWVSDGSGAMDIYGRAVLFGGAEFLGLAIFPIAAKWILIGRWKTGEFPVWGLTYLRFWIVKTLVRANPMVLFVGSPLYVLYLRALGAKIGKEVTILSRSLPVCTDLLAIGAGTVIRKNSFFQCYRAYAGRIQTGPVTLGREVFIGEHAVLDINTAMGDGSQLGHTSALQSGETVPGGQRWHGSPAQRTEFDYLRVGPAKCGTLRRAGFGLIGLLKVFLVLMPLSMGGIYVVLHEVPRLIGRTDAGAAPVTSSVFFTDALFISAVLFFGLVVAGLVVLFTLPRLLHLMIKPGKVYPLYGARYSLHRTVSRMTNLKFFIWLFGDSSYIVHYLKCLGYDLSQVEQTGSNFGIGVQHETPYLSVIGSGTMVADGLSIVNAEFSSSSFSVSRTSIGAHNFLGNFIVYPTGGRTGENCLLATKVMIPLEGEVREGVGLLGSPSFEIPRTVERDTRFDHLRTGDELHSRLSAKNRYNLRTMGVVLLIRWLHFFGLTLLVLATVDRYDALGQLMNVGFLLFSLSFTTLYFALVERSITGFRALEPQACSIYDRRFWRHERLWKVPDAHFNAFNGTPFKNLIWRMLGVRLGKRVFDDGCIPSERSLTAVGDDCMLNAGSHIQCHSQEDGTFKSDHSALGAGCTLGVGALVHYGVTMGDGAVLAADSFLMKGEDIPPHARWGGNPAAELRADRSRRAPAQRIDGRAPQQVLAPGGKAVSNSLLG